MDDAEVAATPVGTTVGILQILIFFFREFSHGTFQLRDEEARGHRARSEDTQLVLSRNTRVARCLGDLYRAGRQVQF